MCPVELPAEREGLPLIPPQFPLETPAWLPFIMAAPGPGSVGIGQTTPLGTKQNNTGQKPPRMRWDNKPSPRQECRYFFYSVNEK